MKRVNLPLTVLGVVLLLVVAVADPVTAVSWELDCDSGAVFTWQAMVTDSVGDPIPSGDYQLTYCYYEDSAGFNLIGCCTTTATVGTPTRGSKDDKAALGGSAIAMLIYAQPIWEDTTKVGHFPKATAVPDVWLELTFNGEVISPLTLVTSVPNAGSAKRMVGDLHTAPGRALILEGAPTSSGMVDILGNDTVASVALYRPTDDILPMMIMEVTDTTSTLTVFDTLRDTMVSITGEGAGTFDGIVWSKTGFKFPDLTIQTTAWTGGGTCNWSVYDSVLYTNNYWGIARGGAGNVLSGDSIHTMVNLGVACTTGAAGGRSYATIGGGFGNLASGSGSTIGGGEQNSANGWRSTVGGGDANTASGYASTVGGGMNNQASAFASTVGGGYSNSANGERSTVSGGYLNIASGYASAVGGGGSNIASGQYSSVGGGCDNTASGNASAVGGGYRNSNAGDYSVIPGGRDDTLTSSADYSMAFGRLVYVNTPYRVVFFGSSNSGRLGINRDDSSGGINYPIHVGTGSINGNGAYLSGGGTWTNGSSRAFKENFQQLDGKDVLNRIEDLPMESWEYKGTGERHIWPCAEDFHQQFDVGVIKEDGMRDTRYLAAGDVAGVALVGVQELYRITQELQKKTDEIEELRAQLGEQEQLKGRVAQLEALVETILAQRSGSRSGTGELALDK